MLGEAVERIIEETRDRWLAEGEADSARRINAGLCEEFAREVAKGVEAMLGAPDPLWEHLAEVCVVNFIEVDPDTDCAIDHGGPFDRALLAAEFPDVRPPEGMDWDDVDAMSAEMGYHAGTHVFLWVEGRFHDAECPEGVDSFFDLPFFRRDVEAFLAMRRAPRP